MHLEEKKLSSEMMFEGKIINLTRDTVLLENGSTATREVVHHSGGVCVIPCCENGDILMVRQYRYPFAEALLELPAGKLEKGESHYDCGLRELREETGTTPREYRYIGEIFPTTAYLTERIHLYIASGLATSKQELDEGEFLDIKRIPLTEAIELVMSGKIRDAKSQIGILKAARLMNI